MMMKLVVREIVMVIVMLITMLIERVIVIDNFVLIQEQRKAENEGVTEDDVNEIKNDISAFRLNHDYGNDDHGDHDNHDVDLTMTMKMVRTMCAKLRILLVKRIGRLGKEFDDDDDDVGKNLVMFLN